MSEAFKSFDWEKDENWLKYKNSVEIPSGNQTQVLEKLKIKFYQKFIVRIFSFILFSKIFNIVKLYLGF